MQEARGAGEAVRRRSGGVGGSPACGAGLDGVGHPFAALEQHDRTRKVWQEALQLYREQGRDNDIERIQRQLDGLRIHGQPSRNVSRASYCRSCRTTTSILTPMTAVRSRRDDGGSALRPPTSRRAPCGCETARPRRPRWRTTLSAS
ncbi:hypothetical protein DMH04_36985 [Kibdelosporangium aridum]|uniref:Tetratricopeptide repeat protein n=1 Tax=Kibdelosporangium aridum TaxID=2030 RepID=A0A428YYK5_KIBAR|nr:hypothetical protein DMH04_36985 [Kibdelosporangium aridum]